MAQKNDDGDSSLILKNRRAYHDYEVLEELECGLVLTGTEVKSLRDRSVTFADCYARVEEDELFLVGLNIAEYRMGNIHNHIPDRRRKMLAHRAEIRKLGVKSNVQGVTLIPLRLYWKRGKAKVAIGIVRGKASHDKRESVKKREFDRERQRVLRRG